MPISLNEFANMLMDAAKVSEAEGEGIARACKLVARKARGMIGVEQPFWPALAQSTIEDKARQGYKVPAPLLREGDLKRSIKIDAPYRNGEEVYGFVYSNSPIARYQELGTVSIPPRPFLSTAAMACEMQVHEIMAASFFKARFEQWRLISDILGKAWDDAKELAEVEEHDEK